MSLVSSVRDHGTLEQHLHHSSASCFFIVKHIRSLYSSHTTSLPHSKNVTRSLNHKIITMSTVPLLILFFLICIVSVSSNVDSAPDDGFIRGQCPRAEDIHPCMCLLLPKHLDSNDGEEENEELVRETREVKLEPDESDSFTTSDPITTSSDFVPTESEATTVPEAVYEDEVSDIELSSDQSINDTSNNAQLKQTSRPLLSASLEGTSTAPRAIYMPPLIPPSSALPTSSAPSPSVGNDPTIPMEAKETRAETFSISSTPSYSIPSTATTPIPIAMTDTPMPTSIFQPSNFSTTSDATTTNTPNSIPITIPIINQSSQPSTTSSPLNVSESPTVAITHPTMTTLSSTSSTQSMSSTTTTTTENPTALELKSPIVEVETKKEVSNHWSLWETMLICRNINSAKVFLDSVKSAKGNNFKDNRKEYFYGRTFKATQVIKPIISHSNLKSTDMTLSRTSYGY